MAEITHEWAPVSAVQIERRGVVGVRPARSLGSRYPWAGSRCPRGSVETPVSTKRSSPPGLKTRAIPRAASPTPGIVHIVKGDDDRIDGASGQRDTVARKVEEFDREPRTEMPFGERKRDHFCR
jgi:hypothetical protein